MFALSPVAGWGRTADLYPRQHEADDEQQRPPHDVSRPNPKRSKTKPPSAGPPSSPTPRRCCRRRTRRRTIRRPADETASAMNASEGVMTSATHDRVQDDDRDRRRIAPCNREQRHACTPRAAARSTSAAARPSDRPAGRRSDAASSSRRRATPKTRPMRAGTDAELAARNSGSTGSSIAIVAEMATTTTAHDATAREPQHDADRHRFGFRAFRRRSSARETPSALSAAMAAT